MIITISAYSAYKDRFGGYLRRETGICRALSGRMAAGANLPEGSRRWGACGCAYGVMNVIK
ncbi:MAG: hypothetical protein LUC22_04725 [Prevotella sp.]|nr:hypothetical protein [Prevotella sp.]